MTLRFLGTGTSQGVPVIGCTCEVCLSNDLRDQRLRSSLLVKKGHSTLSVDCGPDFRMQMLQSDCNHLDGIVFTHEHQDHVAGLDDVRPLNFKSGKNMPLWADRKTSSAIKDRFDYAFSSSYPGAPRLDLNLVHPGEKWEVGDIQVEAVEILHGKLPILGYILDNKVAYFTDVKTIPHQTMDRIMHCEVLIISALRKEDHYSHLTLQESLDLIEIIKPTQAYLMHISHSMGRYQDWAMDLPKGVMAAYDGLEIEL